MLSVLYLYDKPFPQAFFCSKYAAHMVGYLKTGRCRRKMCLPTNHGNLWSRHKEINRQTNGFTEIDVGRFLTLRNLPKSHAFPNTTPQPTVILQNYLHLKKSTRITKHIYTCNIPYIWRLVHLLGDNLELPPSRLMYMMTTETDYQLSNIIFNNHDLLRTKLNSPICV